MKKIIFSVLLSTFLFTAGFAQSEFKKEWETKASLSPTFRTYNHDLSLVLVGDMKDLEMLDGKTGKTIWKFNAKKSLEVKSMVNWLMIENEEGILVQVIYKKAKADSVSSAFLNAKTGEIISSVTEAMLKPEKRKTTKVNSKAIYATSCYDEATNTAVELSYNFKTAIFGGSAIGAGTKLDIEVKATGGNNWSKVVTGKALRHLCNEMLPYGEPDMMVNVIVNDGVVFVIYEGITVLDLATGNKLWETTFDNVTCTMGLSATQEIGRSAFPVTDKEAAYVCDFSKGEKAIKKLDIRTGSLIWKSDKLSGNDIVSKMMVYGNSLIVKFGGIIRMEKYIPNSQGGSTSIVKYEYQGESDIRAYDITTGKLLWNSDKFAKNEKFKNSECNILLDDKQIFACGQKNLYIINALEGQLIGKSDYGNKDIDDATYIFPYNGNIIVEGKKGVSSMSATGKKNFSVSTGKNLYSEFRGDAYLIWNGKSEKDISEFVRVDLNNGVILGKMKGCYKPMFDTTGDYFLWFKDKKVTKYKTSK